MIWRETCLRGLWLYQAHNQIDRDLLRELLNADRHEVRAAAVRVLSYWVDRVDEPLKLIAERIGDDHPRVRLEAVRACSFVEDSDEVAELVLGVVDKGTDAWIDYTLEETLRSLGR